MTNINFSDPTEITERLVSATMLRRNFGAVSKKIASLGYVVLTIKGKPTFKVEKLPRTKKNIKDVLSKFYGAWKGTVLDDDKLWHEILVEERIKGSRKKHIIL